MSRVTLTLATLASAALFAACAAQPAGSDARTATIQRAANDVPHISAPDAETLAYGVGYAYAQDNVCMVADHLVTARGERSRWFGAAATGLLARRVLPNEQIDFLVGAHMDDAALERAWHRDTSVEARSMVRGYVEGYNRYLADQAGKLPAACNGQPWVRPMKVAQYYLAFEILMTQAGVTALADAMLGARPPTPTSALPAPLNLADAADAMREAGVLDSPLGSNAWAFGRDVTADSRGLLVGNPHFPWAGTNRSWQMHLTVPGKLDAMGAGIGLVPAISIGFNRDVA